MLDLRRLILAFTPFSTAALTLLRTPEMLNKKVDERTCTNRLIALAGIVDKQVSRRQLELGQHDL